MGAKNYPYLSGITIVAIMSRILRIGLTGGIGSGKSTACEIFTELGVPVIDADIIAHQLIEKNGVAYPIVYDMFGDKIITADGNIDRSCLRELVFSNADARKRLENVLHPLVFSEIDNQLSIPSRHPYCIVSIPLLVETNAMDKVDRILVIDAPVDLQVARVSSRDGGEKDIITNIIKSQATREQRLKIADDIIKNNADINSMRKEILILNEKYNLIAKKQFETKEPSH